MTGPKDPGGHDSDDWGFPEVDPAGPASTSLPPPEPEPEVVYDTGSDAWWRAQAKAQRAAAEGEPPLPPSRPVVPEPEAPPELVEPEVLVAPEEPTPLDSGWLPPELHAAELHPAEPTPPAAVPPPVTAGPVPPPPVDVTDPHGFPPVADDPIWSGPPEPSFDDGDRTRTAPEPERVGPVRALAGAALAVAGVALAIGALLLLGDDEPAGTPTVALPTTSASAGPTPVAGAPEPTATATATATARATATATATASAVAPIVPVTVLNNSRVKGLADRSAARFRAGGWPVPATGNYRGGAIAETTVYYAAGQQASAQRFATQFGISRVLPRFAGLPGSGVTVVLTRDFA